MANNEPELKQRQEVSEMMEITRESYRWCDRCGPSVRAVDVVTIGDGELDFCGHCLREYGFVGEAFADEKQELEPNRAA